MSLNTRSPSYTFKDLKELPFNKISKYLSHQTCVKSILSSVIPGVAISWHARLLPYLHFWIQTMAPSHKSIENIIIKFESLLSRLTEMTLASPTLALITLALYEPRRVRTTLRPNTDGMASDQPANPCNLI